jgi:hypothetical protein
MESSDVFVKPFLRDKVPLVIYTRLSEAAIFWTIQPRQSKRRIKSQGGLSVPLALNRRTSGFQFCYGLHVHSGRVFVKVSLRDEMLVVIYARLLVAVVLVTVTRESCQFPRSIKGQGGLIVPVRLSRFWSPLTLNSLIWRFQVCVGEYVDGGSVFVKVFLCTEILVVLHTRLVVTVVFITVPIIESC